MVMKEIIVSEQSRSMALSINIQNIQDLIGALIR
jgi:hypothetical protein